MSDPPMLIIRKINNTKLNKKSDTRFDDAASVAEVERIGAKLTIAGPASGVEILEHGAEIVWDSCGVRAVLVYDVGVGAREVHVDVAMGGTDQTAVVYERIDSCSTELVVQWDLGGTVINIQSNVFADVAKEPALVIAIIDPEVVDRCLFAWNGAALQKRRHAAPSAEPPGDLVVISLIHTTHAHGYPKEKREQICFKQPIVLGLLLCIVDSVFGIVVVDSGVVVVYFRFIVESPVAVYYVFLAIIPLVRIPFAFGIVYANIRILEALDFSVIELSCKRPDRTSSKLAFNVGN